MEPEFEPEIELVDLPGHIWDALMTRALSGESFVSNDEVVPDQTDDPTTTDDGTDYSLLPATTSMAVITRCTPTMTVFR